LSAALTWARARPVGSVFAAAIAAAVHLRYGAGPAGVIAALTCAVLVVLSVIDVETRRLPNVIVLPTAAFVLVARLLTDPEHWATWVGAGLGAFACFFLLALVNPAGLGMGDVKLVLLLGFALGTAVLPALVLGTLVAALAGAVLLVRDGREARGRTIPYGPFLAFGAVAVTLLLTP
jgi:leader peptidase (prepilin peptidase)/N-methyltransferase